jgi:hypothetical protein
LNLPGLEMLSCSKEVGFKQQLTFRDSDVFPLPNVGCCWIYLD